MDLSPEKKGVLWGYGSSGPAGVTEWIFRKEIPIVSMSPDPAPAATEAAVPAVSAPAGEQGILVPEQGKGRDIRVLPDRAERAVADITGTKLR